MGVLVCMGIRNGILEKAVNVLNVYRLEIAKALSWIEKEKAIKMEDGWLAYVIAGDKIKDTLISPVVSILSSSGYIPRNGVLLGFADIDGEYVKVSARVNSDLVSKGVHIGVVMQKAAERVKGIGGGHSVAAGAKIPKNKINEFISAVKSLVWEVKSKHEGKGKSRTTIQAWL